MSEGVPPPPQWGTGLSLRALCTLTDLKIEINVLILSWMKLMLMLTMHALLHLTQSMLLGPAYGIWS